MVELPRNQNFWNPNILLFCRKVLNQQPQPTLMQSSQVMHSSQDVSLYFFRGMMARSFSKTATLRRRTETLGLNVAIKESTHFFCLYRLALDRTTVAVPDVERWLIAFGHIGNYKWLLTGT
jgi:hypothetical protein